MAHYPKRILIVEDNKLDMRLLKDILRRERIRDIAGRGWIGGNRISVCEPSRSGMA